MCLKAAGAGPLKICLNVLILAVFGRAIRQQAQVEGIQAQVEGI